jgi:Na+-driven multidrug efflux pump
LRLSDLKPYKDVIIELLPNGLSMGFMLSFVLLGSFALQTAINLLGSDIIVAHTAARKVTMIFLIPLFVLGTALATYCGQNLGAKEYNRIREGIKGTVLISFIWCIVSLVIIYTLAPTFISLITASTQSNIVKNAALYMKVNSVFYILPAVICILRNSMQGFGDTKTPLISSLIELVGKVLIAFLLVPAMRYMGVIISEPIVWAIMVIPLLISINRNPIFKSTKSVNDGLSIDSF